MTDEKIIELAVINGLLSRRIADETLKEIKYSGRNIYDILSAGDPGSCPQELLDFVTVNESK